jgi:hypothetical protein
MYHFEGLVGENLNSRHTLVLRIADIYLNDEPDIFKSSLKVSSMYQAMLEIDLLPHNIHLWKIKLLLKIKVFLWLLYREAILTKDNLVKRNWHENDKSCFCNNYDTILHLFFECVLAKFIWRVIQIPFGLGPPNNIRHTFGAWVHNMNTQKR